MDSPELHAEIDALTEARLRTRRTVKWTWFAPDVLPAWVAEMDFPVAAAVRRAAREVVDASDLGYASEVGLAEAFAGWAKRNQGWEPDPALAAPVGDIMAGLEVTLRTLTEPGDAVTLLTPSYPPFFRLLDDMRLRTVAWPMVEAPDRWELDLDRLEDVLRAGSRVVLLCHPHNPTGRVWQPAELRSIADLVDRYGATVISDEVHAPLLATGETFTPYAASGGPAQSHTVTLTSISKGWNVAGLKCGLVQCEPQTALVAEGVGDRDRARASAPGVAASIAAWTDDEGWLDSTRAYLDRTRAQLAGWVARTPGVIAHPGQAGYLAWLDLSGTGLGADPAEVLLERGRVAVNPGHTFAMPAEQGVGRVRINHATSSALLAEVLGRIDRTIASIPSHS